MDSYDVHGEFSSYCLNSRIFTYFDLSASSGALDLSKNQTAVQRSASSSLSIIHGGTSGIVLRKVHLRGPPPTFSLVTAGPDGKMTRQPVDPKTGKVISQPEQVSVGSLSWLSHMLISGILARRPRARDERCCGKPPACGSQRCPRTDAV